ncbi:MAG: response regulator transcription factor [Parasphingorhabdus sp.]|jgi:two-component system OmpR family response regulator|uniref:response regulator transcription factor n=1 Tax=Parasphingorhabdus sp. TaxID=2709688 RepID=UPI0030039322
MKILLVEDDKNTSDYIAQGLEQAGHLVTASDNGPDGLFHATDGNFDVIILDRMLPGMDGIAIIGAIRGAGETVPILMLTARAGLEDRVDGLDSGADDYLVKPFAFSELHARLNALVRRHQPEAAESTLSANGIELDRLKRLVLRGGNPVELQPREFSLLEELLRNSGKVVTRTMLLERVWNFHFDPKTNIVETHISRLRSKLNEGHAEDAIITVRGAGYMIAADE